MSSYETVVLFFARRNSMKIFTSRKRYLKVVRKGFFLLQVIILNYLIKKNECVFFYYLCNFFKILNKQPYHSITKNLENTVRNFLKLLLYWGYTVTFTKVLTIYHS
jgi:hypothetical protein